MKSNLRVAFFISLNMTQVKKFTFNPFQENTYIVYDETKECMIIDPGAYFPHEREELLDFIRVHALKPIHLINTHCHIDHVLSNKLVAETFGLKLAGHQQEQLYLDSLLSTGAKYGVPVEESPPIEIFIKEGDIISFGNTVLKVYNTPGHSIASIILHCEKAGFALVGDVIFHRSIGRTDLPGGNFEVLKKSILKKVYTLPLETILYCGHEGETTVGEERVFNPFVKMEGN